MTAVTSLFAFQQYLMRHFGGAANVLFVGFTQFIDISSQSRFADCRVLGVNIATSVVVNARNISIPLMLVVQRLMKAHQPVRWATRHQSKVKVSVSHFPFTDVRLISFFGFGQVMKRCDDPRFPVVIAELNALRKRHVFQGNAQVGEIFKFFSGYIRHVKTALPLYIYQAVGGQPIQRFAKWCRTNIIGLLQAFDTQFFTGFKAAVNDVLTQSMISAVGKGFSLHVVSSKNDAMRTGVYRENSSLALPQRISQCCVDYFALSKNIDKIYKYRKYIDMYKFNS